MRKQFLIWLSIAFVLFLTGSLHAVMVKINPIDSPFRWFIIGWFGIGLLYFGIWLIKGLKK